MKKLYDRYLLPKLVHASCRVEPIAEQRAKVVPSASGRVLEIGFGTGLNLPFYDSRRVEYLWGLEPSREMLKLARRTAVFPEFPVELIQARAEEIPLENESVDTVLVTYTLCTIPDVSRAVEEIRRVLTKDGRLLFCEHGASPEEDVLRWQNRLNPFWGLIAGGCHLNRRAPDLLREGGFEMRHLETGYTPGWKVDSFHYWGEAIPT